MIAVMAALIAARAIAAQPPSLGAGAFEARMKASAAAAQALQGRWDGTWILSDTHGRRLFVFQITDPAGGGPLSGAWREAVGPGRTGWIDAITRRGAGLELSFTPAWRGTAMVISLEPREVRLATGWMAAAGPRRPIMLSRTP